MSEIAIEAVGLGKQYQLGERERYLSLRDVLERSVRHPWGTLKNLVGAPQREKPNLVWALRDVSFRLECGTALGVIGMNGAGKTTLLRILTRITDPTEGHAVVRGRVSSLLEVGTGFHPELTGRENIYVNGVMLGMTRQEVSRRLDEIVEFSGIEQFIDTPVKRYSSGMQLRLAFSVAAHLEPDIVLIDEVLAVGDAAFQERCVKKMEEMSGMGRTLIYVSHNLPSVANLCDRAIILDKGRIVSEGAAGDVVENYLNLVFARGESETQSERLRAASRTSAVRLLNVTLEQEGLQDVRGAIDIGKEVFVKMTYEVMEPGKKLFPALHLYERSGIAILASGDLVGMSSGFGGTCANTPHEKGTYTAECCFPPHFFNDKHYFLNLIVAELPDITHVFFENALAFEGYDGGEMRKLYYGEWLGCVRPQLAWTTQPIGQ